MCTGYLRSRFPPKNNKESQKASSSSSSGKYDQRVIGSKTKRPRSEQGQSSNLMSTQGTTPKNHTQPTPLKGNSSEVPDKSTELEGYDLIQTTIETLKTQYEDLQKISESKDDKIKKLEKDNEKLEKDNKSLVGQVTNLTKELSEKKSGLSAITGTLKVYSEFIQGVKECNEIISNRRDNEACEMNIFEEKIPKIREEMAQYQKRSREEEAKEDENYTEKYQKLEAGLAAIKAKKRNKE